jgi:hypothetical protein
MAGVFPDVPIPTIPGQPGQPPPPAGEQCCVWQIHKRLEGERKITAAVSYDCGNVPTTRAQFTLDLRINDFGSDQQPDPCDQQTVIKAGSLLRAQGSVIRRTGGIGIYSGRFEIFDPTGGPPLFLGQIELYEPIGTHHSPLPSASGDSRCDESCKEHIEGWVVGQGQSQRQLQNWAIHAELAGAITRPAGDGTPETLVAVLNGVLIQCTTTPPAP